MKILLVEINVVLIWELRPFLKFYFQLVFRPRFAERILDRSDDVWNSSYARHLFFFFSFRYVIFRFVNIYTEPSF